MSVLIKLPGMNVAKVIIIIDPVICRCYHISNVLWPRRVICILSTSPGAGLPQNIQIC